MYRKILLATDETRESLIALREGAVMAKHCHAEVFLLVVMTHGVGAMMADGVYPSAQPNGKPLLEAGLDRLKRLGLKASGAVVVGEPAQQIGAAATRFGADLVVVGHRKQSLLERWWSGATGAYLVDYTPCTVLIARNGVSDEAFDRVMAADEA